MRTPFITLLTVAVLSVVFAASAFASSVPLDFGSVVSAVPSIGPGTWLQEPGTAAVGGVTQLPSTSSDPSSALFAIGAVLMMFGIAMLALRGAVAKR
jgi:LPXTG-motif cell wall-anchored protein